MTPGRSLSFLPCRPPHLCVFLPSYHHCCSPLFILCLTFIISCNQFFKKEYIWISSDEMDETGADYTELSKPERKTPIQYTNTYIWNLERWQWWPCMQDSKKDTDVYSRLLDSEGEGEGGMYWENGIETCILSCKKWIASLCLIQDNFFFKFRIWSQKKKSKELSIETWLLD